MDVLLLLGLAALVYFLWPRKKAVTSQDLFDVREIYPDGVIELPGLKFRLAVEVKPANLSLRSLAEQAAAWMGFRNFANSLTIPHTFLVQTRYLNLKDYLDNYRRAAGQSPPEIRDYAAALTEWLSEEAEGNNLRDRRCYVIPKFDAASSGVEGGIEINNPIIHSAFKAFSGISKSKLPSDESRYLARDHLTEAAAVTLSSLGSLEITGCVLERQGVIDMIYQTFNRDMASFARLQDASREEAFSLFVRSETPDIILRSKEVSEVA